MRGIISKVNFSKKEILLFVFLFASAFFSVYVVPSAKLLFALVFSLFFFFSKPKFDYIFIIILLFLFDNPGNLFYKSLDMISGSIPFIILFNFSGLLKILRYKYYSKVHFFAKKPVQIYIIWFLFLIIEGVVLGIAGGGKTGMRYSYWFAMIFLIYPVFFILIKTVNNYIDLIKIFKILSIFLIFNFISQILNFVLHESLHVFLGGSIIENWDDPTYGYRNLIRPMYFFYSSFYCLFLSIFFLYNDEKNLSKTYLFIILIISYLTVFITATRGWTIAYTFFLFSIFLYINYKKPTKAGKNMVIGGFSFFIGVIIILNSPLSTQINSILNRYETLDFLLKGDASAGGTNVRLTKRQVPVIEAFYERPVTGWGFSAKGMETWDGHVGNQSILLIGGVIGLIIILYFILYIINKFNQLRLINNNTDYLIENRIVIFSLLSLFIIHSSSAQVFGYFRYMRDYGSGAVFLGLYLALLNIIYFHKRNIY